MPGFTVTIASTSDFAIRDVESRMTGWTAASATVGSAKKRIRFPTRELAEAAADIARKDSRIAAVSVGMTPGRFYAGRIYLAGGSQYYVSRRTRCFLVVHPQGGYLRSRVRIHTCDAGEYVLLDGVQISAVDEQPPVEVR